MPIPSETIALPIVKGLDVQTDARLVSAPALLEAENTQFSGGGAKKRRGHLAYRVRTEAPVIEATGDETWVYGAGFGDESRLDGEEDERFWTFQNPEVAKLFGVFARDNESVVWDGFRVLSYTPSQLDAQAPFASEVDGSTTIPTLRSAPLAKFSEQQVYPEFADNGLIKLMAWISGADAKYAIYDSTSDALIARGTFAVTQADYMRVFSLGEWMHIAIRDNSDDKVKLFSIYGREPNSITFRSYGDANHFDLWKYSDSEAVLARSNAEGIDVFWIGTNGSGSPTRTQFHYNTTAGMLSVGATEFEVSVVWVDGGNIHAGLFDMDGTLWGTEFIVAPGVQRLSVSPKKVPFHLVYAPWDIYWDDGTNAYTQRYWRESSENGFISFGSTYTRYHLIIASRAFRVGDRTFIWAGHQSDLQSTWFLLDEALLPVGKMEFALADVSGLGGNLRGINFQAGEDYDSLTPKFQLALPSKTRVVPAKVAPEAIYSEPFPRAVTLNFLPRLRTAQAGRCTYIAGAQLWAFDGKEMVEAGFHLGPEPTYLAGVGGSLDNTGQYSYRVDLCHRNAQGEEVRSLSILSNTIDLGGVNSKITLTIPTVITRREDAYFLIYRNAMSSGVPLVNWWLLNSRDPASPDFLANNLSVSTVSYIDTGSVDDEEIQTRELHPASDTYVQPVSAPACEVIAAGRDRIWVAGGELSPGKVAPSRLFEPGEVPSFNPYLELQVDRSNEPVTALGFAGDVALLFRRNSTYLLDSDGPDNNASGGWNPPRLALADTGAVSQDSILRTTRGIIFQSPAGFRQVGPGGGLEPIGLDIDSAAKDFTVLGAILSEQDQEARFYGEDGAYVFNYLYGTWAHWTCAGIGVTRAPSGLALLARQDGYLWIEDEDTYRDASATYTHRIRTSWLHGGNLGDFQRVRRVGGLGRFRDLNTPTHTLRLEIFYDEREFWEERIEWSLPDTSTNQDTWGAGDWGDGVWGDTSATVNNLEDLTWEWVRRPSRQKCSVFSVALEDVNTDGPGFVLSAFSLELARKSGLNRTSERTGTGTNR